MDGVVTALTYGSGSCSGAFPTQVTTNGVSHYYTWNCDGGVKLTGTDANGNVWTTGYAGTTGVADPFWRVSSIQDPMLNSASRLYSATTLEKRFSFGSSLENVISTADGYGRDLLSQRSHGSSYDTVSRAYGYSSGAGAFVKTSAPCSQSLGVPCATGYMTVTADGAGRGVTLLDANGRTVTTSYSQNDIQSTLTPPPSGEHVKSVQSEFDGLGRIKSTCSVVVGSLSSCGQATAANGILTSFAYSTSSGTSTVTVTKGVQIRTKTVDALGRTILSSNPESGTTHFYYDVQSTCPSGTLSGHLAKIVDAKGNVVCFAYEASTGKLSTINANGTFCKHFFYDGSSGFTGVKPPGIIVNNPYDHLVEAATSDCAGHLKTDEWFSYDSRGQMTDFWESTPHSGGYYHTTATYSANMSVASIGGIPGFTTETYGLDADGRVFTAKEGTNWIVNNVSFNAFGKPLSIAIGNAGADSDTYTYDSITGKMTTWTFTIGSTPITQAGTLTWNSNGTLQTLAIVDGFNSDGTQTCNFLYDDLNRLVNDDCGLAKWGQSFSYDQYDNLTKAVISGHTGISWNPGYSPSTNQFTLAGTSYDANGNVLNDTFHAYTWNGFNRLSTIDGTACGVSGICLTYDAMDRVVEKSANALYTEVLYGPATMDRPLAIMNGMTTQSALLPLPGGALLYKPTDSNRQFWHLDWLGSARLSSTVFNRTYIFDRGFAPYGETVYNHGGNVGLDFTGDLQNLVNGTYDTPNRELNPSQGRWISPDPSGKGWNLYAYGVNPNGGSDPSGLAMLMIGREAGTPFSGDTAMAGEATLEALDWQPAWGSSSTSADTSSSEQGAKDSATTDTPVSTSQTNQCGFWCRLGQRFVNVWHGYGFRTDQAVEDILQRDAKWLMTHNVNTEGMSETELINTYNAFQRAIQSGRHSFSVESKLFIIGMIGSAGPQFKSKTLWESEAGEHIDVENPAPGKRAGQIHFQDAANNKFQYNFETGKFDGLSNTKNENLLSEPDVQQGIQKGYKYLGLDEPEVLE
jgi:RHS repeat-associated protein